MSRHRKPVSSFRLSTVVRSPASAVGTDYTIVFVLNGKIPRVVVRSSARIWYGDDAVKLTLDLLPIDCWPQFALPILDKVKSDNDQTLF